METGGHATEGGGKGEEEGEREWKKKREGDVSVCRKKEISEGTGDSF